MGFKRKNGKGQEHLRGVTRTSLGTGRDGSVKKCFLNPPQTGGSPGDFFARQEKKIQTSPNSGKSPGKKVTRPDINNQQLACNPQGEHTTEDLLRFDRALEAQGESTHPTKDEVFAKKKAAYGQPNTGASRCPTHLYSAPPPVAVGKTTDGLSQLAVRSALRLKMMGLPGLIVSVRGEPDIYSAVVALPHKAAPLLDHYHSTRDRKSVVEW